jgi:hypothetical protein
VLPPHGRDDLGAAIGLCDEPAGGMPLESEQFDDLARGRLHTALTLVGAITLGGDRTAARRGRCRQSASDQAAGVTLLFAIPPDGNEGVQAKMNDRTLGSDPVPLYRTAFSASSGTNHSSNTNAATSCTRGAEARGTLVWW